MNFDGKYQKSKTFFIGIGGISRAGKSTLVKKLCSIYNVQSIHFDKFLIAPIEKYDDNIKEIINDWEDPACYNIEKFKEMLSDLKEETIREKRIFIVEGFLIYSRRDISDILDCRLLLDVEKEIARDRRKKTKDYPSDYYYDEYIWKGYQQRKYNKCEIAYSS
jgi:uridine kinase